MLHYHCTLTAVAGQFQRHVRPIRAKGWWFAETLMKTWRSHVKPSQPVSFADEPLSQVVRVGRPGIRPAMLCNPWVEYEDTSVEVRAGPSLAC